MSLYVDCTCVCVCVLRFQDGTVCVFMVVMNKYGYEIIKKL